MSERLEHSTYWSTTAELVVCQGGTLTREEAEEHVRHTLQRLIGTGEIFGAFITGTTETPGELVDPWKVARR